MEGGHSGEPVTVPTDDDGVLEQLRADGLLGPFTATDRSGRSHRGLVRDRNEDALALEAEVFIVADGIGGHSHGELASATAIEAFAAASKPSDEVSARELICQINQLVVDAAIEAGAENMGTTLVALMVQPTHVLVASIGDSRCYRYRDGLLDLLTTDHNVATELLEAGVAAGRATEAGVRPDLLTSYIGMAHELSPKVFTASYAVHSEDRFLLCSDGVYGCLDSRIMVQAMGAPTCEDAVDALIAAVLAVGGPDNATAIVVQMEATSR